MLARAPPPSPPTAPRAGRGGAEAAVAAKVCARRRRRCFARPLPRRAGSGRSAPRRQPDGRSAAPSAVEAFRAAQALRQPPPEQHEVKVKRGGGGPSAAPRDGRRARSRAARQVGWPLPGRAGGRRCLLWRRRIRFIPWHRPGSGLAQRRGGLCAVPGWGGGRAGP